MSEMGAVKQLGITVLHADGASDSEWHKTGRMETKNGESPGCTVEVSPEWGGAQERIEMGRPRRSMKRTEGTGDFTHLREQNED
jgi:hypothetical protein